MTPTAYLTLYLNGDRESVYQFAPGDEIRIGRALENDVVLSDERCSRHHALIYRNENRWFIRDLGSRNGTHVDDQPLASPKPLESGAQILIGHTVLDFEIRESESDDEKYASVGTGVFGVSDDSGSAPREDEFDPSTIIHHRNTTSFLKREQDESDGDTTVNRTTKFGHGAADLCRLAFLIGKAGEIDVIAKTALEGLLGATNGSGAGLWLFPYNEKGEQKASDLRLISNATNTEVHYMPISESLANTVIQRKEAVLVNESGKNRGVTKAENNRISQNAPKVDNTLAAPIRKDDEILGLIHLYIATSEHSLDPDDLEYTLAVADTVAVALGQLNRRKELAANLKQVRTENTSLRELLHTDSEIIGVSRAMKSVGDLIGRAADGKATLLIRGESGTGKELIARAVHFASARKSRPMICINCAAIAESLLASELFGHEKGAFTGAVDRKPGKFEVADSGTLFLDEIGEMPAMLQSKLLRVLEGHSFERVGGNTPVSVDVRVIAATNRDLEREVAEGRFRHDLFFRLRVLEIIVPPLRKRTEDIPILAGHFLEKFSRETGRKYRDFADDAMNALMLHRWPGNVRELKNVIERAVVLGTPPFIREQDLLLSTLNTTGETDIRASSPLSHLVAPSQAALFTPQTLEEVEREHIRRTLEYAGWNKSLAARTLGIERTTLDRKIKRYSIEETTKTRR